MTERDDMPFDATWILPGLDWRAYNKILIRGVDTTHLAKMGWWQDASFAEAVGDRMSHIRSLAGYLQQSFANAYTTDPKQSFEVVTTIDHDTLILEMALVEVVPTKVWLNVVSKVVVGAFDEGSAAFEARIRDSRGNVLAKFKDRERGQMSLISVADLTWYSHAHHIMDQWAKKTVEVMNAKPGEKVSPMWTVTLRPY